jgi:hypothetical protein
MAINKETKYMTGLIIFPEDKKDDSLNFIHKTVKKYKLDDGDLGVVKSIGGFYVYTIHGYAFKNYNLFDSFLLELSKEFNNLNSKGLLLGHLDKGGFLWSDYVR